MNTTERRVKPSYGARGYKWPRMWIKRLGWMAMIWITGVVALGVVAVGLRLLMKCLGLSY